MINYIYNHMVYFTRMREFAWSVSDCEELVGLYNTFIFPSLYNEIGKELKNSMILLSKIISHKPI